MRHKKAVALCLPILLCASVSFKCGGASSARRTYARATSNIGASIKEMINVKRSLAEQGKITKDEDFRLTQALLRANDALRAANAETDIEDPERAVAARLISDLSSSLNELSESGIKPIQNPEARSKLQGVLETTKPSITAISAFTQDCESLGGKCFRCPSDPCIYCPSVPPNCPK